MHLKRISLTEKNSNNNKSVSKNDLMTKFDIKLLHGLENILDKLKYNLTQNK